MYLAKHISSASTQATDFHRIEARFLHTIVPTLSIGNNPVDPRRYTKLSSGISSLVRTRPKPQGISECISRFCLSILSFLRRILTFSTSTVLTVDVVQEFLHTLVPTLTSYISDGRQCLKPKINEATSLSTRFSDCSLQPSRSVSFVDASSSTAIRSYPSALNSDLEALRKQTSHGARSPNLHNFA